MHIPSYIGVGDEGDMVRIQRAVFFWKLRCRADIFQCAPTGVTTHPRHDRAVTAVLNDRLTGIADFKTQGVEAFGAQRRAFQGLPGSTGPVRGFAEAQGRAAARLDVTDANPKHRTFRYGMEVASRSLRRADPPRSLSCFSAAAKTTFPVVSDSEKSPERAP